MEKKINTKDLVYLGTFTVLFMMATVIGFSVTFTPIIQFSRMFISAFLGGPFYLLFVTRVQKPCAVLIMGLFSSVLVGWLLFGSPVYALVAFAFFVAGELILFVGKYSNLKMIMLSYIPVAFWPFGPYGAWWYDTEAIYDLSVSSTYTVEFTDGILALINSTSLVLVLASTLIGGILSILFSKALFKKHFKRAGLI